MLCREKGMSQINHVLGCVRLRQELPHLGVISQRFKKLQLGTAKI